MIIEFEEKNHVYTINGDIADISITELLAKHHLAPNYSAVKKDVLDAKASKGKEIHEDLENVLNKANYEPKTPQGANFKKWVDENLSCGVGEQMLGMKYFSLSIAGTADVMGFTKDKEPIVADHKCTSTFHREYVSWQVSIEDYIARRLKGEKLNGRAINWQGAKKFYCFHYSTNEDGEMRVYELEKIPDEEIERLIDCEYHGKIYERRALSLDKDLITAFEETEISLRAIEEQQKAIKANSEKMRATITELMRSQGIKSWESPDQKIKVTYVAPTERIQVDSNKLKHDFPLTYNECQKIVRTKESIRITIKDNENF